MLCVGPPAIGVAQSQAQERTCTEQAPCTPSLASLLADPMQYVGQYVKLKGHVYRKPEGVCLYPDPAEGDSTNPSNRCAIMYERVSDNPDQISPEEAIGLPELQGQEAFFHGIVKVLVGDEAKIARVALVAPSR